MKFGGYTDGIMVVTYHGAQCFRVSKGDSIIAFDPISKTGADYPPVRFGADVVFSSMHHPNFFGIDALRTGSKEPFVVHGPGEYEVGEVTARGFGVTTTYADTEKNVTIYQVQLEGINLVFLGALGSADIDPKILSELGDVDILFIPIGGGEVLDVPDASKLAVKLEAKIVIPMHYDERSLGAFLKEEGVETKTPIEKLTLKKKDLAEMNGEVIVLANV